VRHHVFSDAHTNKADQVDPFDTINSSVDLRLSLLKHHIVLGAIIIFETMESRFPFEFNEIVDDYEVNQMEYHMPLRHNDTCGRIHWL
jgi:hypothetical protein